MDAAPDLFAEALEICRCGGAGGDQAIGVRARDQRAPPDATATSAGAPQTPAPCTGRGERDNAGESRRAGVDFVALDLDRGEPAPEPDHDAGDAAVAHQQV